MKRFISIVIVLVILFIVGDYIYFHTGWYINLNFKDEVSTISRVEENKIYLDTGLGFENFEIRGVDMGSGTPGEWSTDFEIDKETYLKWFKQIKDMGANTIRIYTVQSSDFYNALYEFNSKNPDPLYLIHGVWINDYILNSRLDAYASEFFNAFERSCQTMLNVVHGKCKLSKGELESAGYGTYRRDVSPWVIGYILGVEWEDATVAYTNEKYYNNEKYNQYDGKYFYTTEEATPFEAMLAAIGDKVVKYESERYGTQRILAFSNWPTTDPFDYPETITDYFMKCASVDVEHIKTKDAFISGQFASYHVYPYYPDYLLYMDDWSNLGLGDKNEYIRDDGALNTYFAYLSALTKHHTMPVIISEFGVSTGRGIAQRDRNTNRNQGNMSEEGQGKALVECYEDIMNSGCAGCCVFTWQDEWFKRTWNTMYAIDLKRTPYWSDYQTNEQYFGLLSFDPGTDSSICYVDGDVSEWSTNDIVSKNNDTTIYLKYDEKFIYLRINKLGYKFGEDTLYIPFDITPNSGSTWDKENNLFFDRAADFILTIHNENDSRLQVQEYYEALRANYSENVYGFNSYYVGNVPLKDSPKFVNINMILQTSTQLLEKNKNALAEVFETGKLTYGDSNPSHDNFNSLADFICVGDDVEVKIPWQLLNFADPSRMMIHDDYYNGENYGVSQISISEIYIGVSGNISKDRIKLEPVELKGWDNKVTSHERLKTSYYMMQELWGK